MTSELQRLVHECLDNALLNGYTDDLAKSAEEIAGDLVECTAWFEAHDSEDLIPHIETWQNNRKK